MITKKPRKVALVSLGEKNHNGVGVSDCIRIDTGVVLATSTTSQQCQCWKST